ncbi:ATP-binding protein [Pontiellaceae bacterium B12227]|nr:ATP-binding protein [Pontiellaceae bacterium B12227]
MNSPYINREIEGLLKTALQEAPVVAVTGPRQTGKSTLLRESLPGYAYVTLDDPLLRQQAIEDPLFFLGQFESKLIIDEFQYAPDLLHYIKIRVDENRRKKGQYVLTGSQQFVSTKGISESLAGRIILLELGAFSCKERARVNPVDSKTDFIQACLRGSFPELVTDPALNTQRWYGGYLQTYLERDIRTLYDIGSLREFERTLQLLAARCSQTLNLSTIARDIGVSVNTIKRWVSILEACRLIYLLPPYFKNIGSRIVKSPKVYFLDAGLACYLTGLESEAHLLNGPMAGALFENYCIQEAVKHSFAQGKQPRFCYLRTQNGFEVDFIAMRPDGKLFPAEFKLSQTPKTKMAAPLERFITQLEQGNSENGGLVSITDQSIPLTRNVTHLSIADFLNRL